MGITGSSGLAVGAASQHGQMCQTLANENITAQGC